MVWSEERVVTFLREVAADGLLTKTEKSRERGAGWQTVANNNLSSKHKASLAREMRASGEGGDELTEREESLEELM